MGSGTAPQGGPQSVTLILPASRTSAAQVREVTSVSLEVWSQAVGSGASDSPWSAARSLGQRDVTFGKHSRSWLALFPVLLYPEVNDELSQQFTAPEGPVWYMARSLRADSSVLLRHRPWLQHVIFTYDIIGCLVPRLLTTLNEMGSDEWVRSLLFKGFFPLFAWKRRGKSWKTLWKTVIW